VPAPGLMPPTRALHLTTLTPAPPRPEGATGWSGGCSEAVLSLAQPAVPIPRNESARQGAEEADPTTHARTLTPAHLAPKGRRDVAAGAARLSPASRNPPYPSGQRVCPEGAEEDAPTTHAHPQSPACLNLTI